MTWIPLDEWNGIQMTELLSIDGMKFKWWNVIQMIFGGQNELGMVRWQWNDIQMTKWHSNDGMISEWCFKVEMS